MIELVSRIDNEVDYVKLYVSTLFYTSPLQLLNFMLRRPREPEVKPFNDTLQTLLFHVS